MPLSAAERQARYRQRVKAKPAETLEQAFERLRQVEIDETIAALFDDARMVDSEPHAKTVAMLRAVKAEPPRTGDDFERWLQTLIADSITHDIRLYKKGWRRTPGGLQPKA